MHVKIETKEKFVVLTPEDADITANMAAAWAEYLKELLLKEQQSLVVNMEKVTRMDPEVLSVFLEAQQSFYHEQHSFVLCCLQSGVLGTIEENENLEGLNMTPTESEAWDIVQMEEVERELMRDWDDADDTATDKPDLL